MAKARNSGKAVSVLGGPGDLEPTLPAWKAFVVQFSRETGGDRKEFSGRVEHLSTGQKALFESSDDLIAFVQAVLGEAEAPRR